MKKVLLENIIEIDDEVFGVIERDAGKVFLSFKNSGMENTGKALSLKDRKDAISTLRELDKNYQAASEVILFELGENMVNHGTFSHRLRSLMATMDNNFYCSETGYQTPTKQKLYSR